MISAALIKKYDVKGPYYTSYPTGKVWSDEFGEAAYKNGLREMLSTGENNSLTLYVHFPFCSRRCRFCFCYTTVTHNRAKIDAYLQTLAQEIQLLKDFFSGCPTGPSIKKIHLGGGSPSYMNEQEFDFLVEQLRLLVDPHDLEEFTIEIDAITVNKDTLKRYGDSGINRISFGIQDFDPQVQQAIGRVQSPQLIEELLEPHVRSLFKSVNFDLMYGLPLQTRTSFKAAIDQVISLAPDRIALYNYFHMPELYRPQAAIDASTLPDVVEKSMIFLDATQHLLHNGYDSIGIDHFAKKTEELALAKHNHTLCRHFMGYTAGKAPNIIGLGPSSLGGFTRYYAQNVYSLEEHRAVVTRGQLPILRGYAMDADDLVRRDVINTLLCYFNVDFKDIEDRHRINFRDYFCYELERLAPFEEDGMLCYSKGSITMTEEGQPFARHVCVLFDKHLRQELRNGSASYVPQVQRSGCTN